MCIEQLSIIICYVNNDYVKHKTVNDRINITILGAI